VESLNNLRKKRYYRFWEGFIGYASYSFLLFILLLSWFNPSGAAIFLIIYSFLWLLRAGLISIHTIYNYKNMTRWESVDWNLLSKYITNEPIMAVKYLQSLAVLHSKSLDWQQKIDEDILAYRQIIDTKYQNILGFFMAPIFATYNESPQILERSLRKIYESGYPLKNLTVFVSQEARIGQEFNDQTYNYISNIDWIQATEFSETDLEKVYTDHSFLEYKNPELNKIKLSDNKLNVIFTRHPDGLVGEIKGKASNEDWAARHISLFCKSRNIDQDLVLITSLDADSSIGDNFFQMLAYRFALSENRHQAGFQPIPVYANNYFQSNLLPRLIATQTTLWEFAQTSWEGEVHFFANYSVPLRVLQKVDFWVREVISEDSQLYYKCFAKFQGNFEVIPFYGIFYGDVVEGDDYFESFHNQYKQLQRWSWGAVEGFPYIIQTQFIEPGSHQIDLRKKIKSVLYHFTNHFFWATTPLVLSIGLLIPLFLGGPRFGQTQIAQNLSSLSSVFAIISILFMATFGYITFHFIGKRAIKNTTKKYTTEQKLMLVLQWIISPYLYGFMGIPALDSQLKGIRGKYMGYWVTPKK